KILQKTWSSGVTSIVRSTVIGFYKSVVSWDYFCLITVEITVLFGAKVLEHVLNLCRGKYDFLDRLPVPLLLDIISFLELENIARLSQVSCRFEMDDVGWVGMVFERSLFPTSCSVQQQVIGRMER
uniref:F-box domain-containing protein n=1 Tax=Cairina moschata TaxID=8855 RepID=A0A8C3BF03_CAIMO